VTVDYAVDLVAEARRDAGHGRLASPRSTGRSANPSCGDDIEMDIDHDDERVVQIAHRTRGCVFTRASASLIARFIPGMTLSEARHVATSIRRDLAGTGELPGVFASLGSVRTYPARTRCALLPWDALLSALSEA
jgi:nitrogen fixation protein NifU and related proteins